MEPPRITIRFMPPELWQRVKLLATRRRCRMVDVLVEALTTYLDREEAK